jgi:hypothetical protein
MDKQRYENGFIGQYTRENHILQDNRNVKRIILLPHKIYGTKEKQLLGRIESQKQYKLAIRHFIAVYQSYEKIGALLQEAKVMGDLVKIEYLSHLYMKNVSDLMHSINSIDQMKKRLNTYIVDNKDSNLNVLKTNE